MRGARPHLRGVLTYLRPPRVGLAVPRVAHVAEELLCTSAALALQVHRADMRLQGAGRPERHVLAVATGVAPALLVHHLDVRLQAALAPEGAGAVGAVSNER
jgi:hypothetical protein